MSRSSSVSAGLKNALAACILLMVVGRSFSPGGMPVAARGISGPTLFASTDFEAVWRRSDAPVASGQASRSWLWGPAPGATLTEPFSGVTGGNRLVQYFDKARMETNSAVTDTTSLWHVTTGLLVSEMVEGRVQVGQNTFTQTKPSQQVVAGDPQSASNPRYSEFRPLAATKSSDKTGQSVSDRLPGHPNLTSPPSENLKFARFIPETGHNIPDVLWSYMGQTGPQINASGQTVTGVLFSWVYLMGYPITEPYWASLSIDGKPQVALVQLFQRRVLTYVPTFPAGWQVQMGNVGQHYYEWRYSSAPAPAPAPAATSATSTAVAGSPGGPQPIGGGFVGISGKNFVYRGTEVKLKGTNYWLSNAPFVGTWASWNGPQVMSELEKAHQLGVNTVRIGIPYDHRDTRDVVWGNDDNEAEMVKVGPWIKSQMTQLLQIASGYGMKVIFVLFEWYDGYPAKGSHDDRTNMAYLEGIVGPFANDDRVLAWDLHNEPDYYDSWRIGNQSLVIEWLQRIASAVRALDNRHPITVGVGDYRSLWAPSADGTRILDLVDFAAFHSYNAGALSGEITEIKSRTSKPVVLEEMGWPTGLGGEAPRDDATFDETTQTFLYKTMLVESKSADLAGVVQWTLWDYWGGQTRLIPGHERFFGLVKADGSFKPAAGVYKSDYMARDLPSDTRTNVPLDTSDKPNKQP